MPKTTLNNATVHARAAFIIFPKLEHVSIPHYQNAHGKRLSKRSFSSCCVYHRTRIASTSREEGLVTAQPAIAQFHPWSRVM